MSYNEPYQPWEDDLLTKQWGCGLSAAQIARQLPGRTRNSVIGRAHRLGLKARPSPIIRRDKGFWRKLVPHLIGPAVRLCEWPDGCNAQRTTGSYCDMHHAKAYKGKPKRQENPGVFRFPGSRGKWS